eukprot:1182161-Prorocentrum_minimum.AAC.1
MSPPRGSGIHVWVLPGHYGETRARRREITGEEKDLMPKPKRSHGKQYMISVQPSLSGDSAAAGSASGIGG